MEEGDINSVLKALKNKEKIVVMLAPSFVAEFSYPEIVFQLKKAGFDKIVELTFGAKMINRDYHKQLCKSKQLLISSVCPGIVETINSQMPQYKNNLIKVNSPMVATAKICKKIFPKHKVLFISPCHFKKTESKNTKIISYVLDYQQLKQLFKQLKIEKVKIKHFHFDKFYNEYTKIYPLTGGLSKTAHLKGIIKKEEVKVIDGIANVLTFLKNPDKKTRFLDVNFCVGGCVGGPCISSRNIEQNKKKVLTYLTMAKHENIPEVDKGLVKKAKGISFINE